jgi:CheY-like chemotaxis protein
VDDDKTFATVVCDIAGERGFRCVAAPTADAALALVNESPPDIVLLDLRLPDHPGLFVLDQLKRNPKTKHIPVHVLSAFDEVKSARTLGAFDYTVKPLDRTALIALLERLRARLGGAKRVLAVSANSALLDELSHLLATEHVEIVTAETVADACKHFEKTSFDCIVAALEAGHDELLRALGAPFNRTLPPVVLYATTPLGDDEEERLMRYSRYVTMARATSPEGLVEEVSLAMKGPPSAREASKADGRPRPLAQTRDAILAGQTVLLAEDDVRNVFSITSLLSARGGRVVTARTGVQALSLLDQHEDIALVLMDIMMPEMDGLTAIREIRQRGGRYTTLPIIAITAKAMREDQQRCIEAGASDCLAKPLDVERLVSLVRVWLS